MKGARALLSALVRFKGLVAAGIDVLHTSIALKSNTTMIVRTCMASFARPIILAADAMTSPATATNIKDDLLHVYSVRASRSCKKTGKRWTVAILSDEIL